MWIQIETKKVELVLSWEEGSWSLVRGLKDISRHKNITNAENIVEKFKVSEKSCISTLLENEVQRGVHHRCPPEEMELFGGCLCIWRNGNLGQWAYVINCFYILSQISRFQLCAQHLVG